MWRTKKWFILVLCLLCLPGCGRQENTIQQSLEFRTSLMEAGGCSFTARIRADYGDRIYDFTMAGNAGVEETSLEVLAPDYIAGISAVVSDDGTTLTFDGVELEFGRLANGLVSPVTAPWLLAQCWEQAYIAYSGSDGDQERVTYLRGYNEEEVAVDTWFSDGVPVYAEVTCENVRCLTIGITDFRLNS